MRLGKDLDGLYFQAKLEWISTRHGSGNSGHRMLRITQEGVRCTIKSTEGTLEEAG